MIKSLIEGLLDLVYPPNCIVCKNSLNTRLPHHPLCPQCQHKIQWNKPPFCPRCSRHLSAESKGSRCRDCEKNPIHFDFAWSACLYTDLIRTLIHKFKYEQKTYLRFFLSQLMTAFVKQYNFDIAQFDFIMPIPLFSSRRRERGYNQSELLAALLADSFHSKILTGELLRVKNTKSQAYLSGKERWTNIHGAFKMKSPWKIKNMSILLIDDLLTTGATVSEAARCLKLNGAAKVGVLTPAITLEFKTKGDRHRDLIKAIVLPVP